MDRRRFLAASSAVLAGCLGDDEPADDGGGDVPGNGSAPPSTSTGEDERSRGLSRAYWEPCSSPDAVAGDVPGTDLTIALTPPCGSAGRGRPDLYVHFTESSDDGPLLVRALLHNPAPTAATVKRYPLFGRQRALLTGSTRGGSDGWYFAPTAEHELVDDAVAHERDASGAWRLASDARDPSTWLPETVGVDAGDSVEGEYAVVLPPRGDPGESHAGFGADAPVDLGVYSWDRTRPGPREPSRFDGRSYPSIASRWLRAAEDRPRDRTMAWYHEADEGTEQYLRPSAERVRLPAKLELTLVDHSDRKIRVAESDWSLHKYVQDDWYRVAPSPLDVAGGSGEAELVNAGRSTRWSTYLFRDAPLDVGDAVAVGHLGGGTYAFDTHTSSPRGSQAAVFEVDAEPLAVEPDPAVRTRRSGTTLDVGRGGDVAVAVERISESRFRAIPEQVMSVPALRHTVPWLQQRHEIDRVRYRTTRDAVGIATHTAEPLADAGRSVTFSFQGVSYRVSTEPI